MSELTYDTFAGREGETFEVATAAGPPRTLTLRSVSRERAADGRGETFVLVFHGGGEMLQQGTYLFRPAQIGEEPIFIVPVGHETDGFAYEAVFTRFAAD